MRLGVCWYPEQWPETDWADDVARMAELGLELVRVGEFAWSRMEPRRGAWDLGWLDRAIALVADAGMRVVLGIPTATPPVWLLRERPDIRLVGPDGRVRPYGSRRHTCPTSPAYREESARVAEVLADRYAGHPAVEAWQIDNEPGNHDSARCWCDGCQDAFRGWLADRHGDVEDINAAWGTAFWSMTYPDLDAVELPAPTMTAHNPSLEVAHRRFASAQVVDGLAALRDVVLAVDPMAVTFTNLYMGDLDIDAQAVHRLHGLGAIDSYPHGVAGPEEVAFGLDLARGAALPPDAGAAHRGGRAWVVEQQPGAINWTGDNPAVAPGQVGDWIAQAARHGIEALLVFRWRMARAGQEQHHAALLTHDRRDTPACAEVRAAAQALAADPPGRPPATAAVVVDYGDAWILDVVPQVTGADHRRLAVAAHAALRAAGHVVDVVPADADLTGYAVVALPALHQVTADRLRRVEAALDAGVLVLVGARSLVRDPEVVWVDVPTPAGLTDRLGAHVVHAGSPGGWPRGGPPSAVAVRGEVVPAGPWIEALALDDPAPGRTGPEVVGVAVGGPLDGAPVAVRRGGLVHVGATSVEAWTAVLRHVGAAR
ncbi:beta-galactosidase [Euzebya sp.]|uniref:beta-galactosidase n=1 Tax=Euzebya sp. TaxID=1971409 RepID=UPI0035112A7F